MQANTPRHPGARRLARVLLFVIGILLLDVLRAAEPAPALPPAKPAVPAAAETPTPAATPAAGAAATPAAVPVPDPEPEAAPAAPPTRIQRVQAALTQALVRLRDGASKDDDRFFVPPIRQRTVVDWKEVEVRYTKKLVDQPIYEYESYKTIANVKTGDSITAASKLTTVVRQRIKRQTGTRQIEQLIQDPKGDVVVMVKQPIYGPGGPNLLYPGFYGENAICLLACIKCGIPPEDALFARTAQRLADYLDAYGLPDRTWDLAWLTVAFANLPQTVELNKTLTERLVRKLLLGQVTDGPGAGLWGPLAIHPTILAHMVEYERKVYERKVEPWEEKLKQKPDLKRYQEKLEEGKALVNGFREQYGDIAQQGLQFEHLREVQVIPPRADVLARVGWGLEESAVYGLPVFIYGEVWTDVEDTSLVLFALREAQVNGCLPEKVSPPMDLDGGRIGEPVESAAAIEKAFAALAKLVEAKGTCPEGVFHTPVHAFDRLGVLGVPVDEKTFQPVTAKVTVASTAQSQAGLMDAEQLVAGRQGAPTLTPKVVAAQRNLRQTVKTFLDRGLKGRDAGEYVDSYDFILQLSRSLTSRTAHSALDRDMWCGLTDVLLSQQLADGAWRDKSNGLNLQPALRECVDLRVREYMLTLKGVIPKRQPGWTAVKEEELIRAQWRAHYYAGRVSTDLVSTAYSALLLSEGLRSPVIGVWAWDGNSPRTAPAAQVVKRLAEQNHVRLQYAVLASDLPATATEGVPALYLSGTGRFAPADAGTAGRLGEFLRTGGLLMVEYPANDAGLAFASGLRQTVVDALPSLQANTLAATATMPEIKVLNNQEGRVAVVFLPAELPGPPAALGALKPAQTKEACFQLLLGAVDPAFLKPDYAINFPEVVRLEKQHVEDEMAARQKALDKAAEKPAEKK